MGKKTNKKTNQTRQVKEDERYRSGWTGLLLRTSDKVKELPEAKYPRLPVNGLILTSCFYQKILSLDFVLLGIY